MPKAIFNDVVIAESDSTEMVEGNHYFPPSSIKMEYFSETEKHTTCPWKGLASYYTIEVDGETLDNGAWTYKDPKSAAANIKDHVAFYGQVKIEN